MSEIFSKTFIEQIIQDYKETFEIPIIEYETENVNYDEALIDIYEYNFNLKKISELKKLYNNLNDEFNKDILLQKKKELYAKFNYDEICIPLKLDIKKEHKNMQLNEMLMFDKYYFNLILLNKIVHINDHNNNDIYLELLDYQKETSLDKIRHIVKNEFESYYKFINASSSNKKVNINITFIE